MINRKAALLAATAATLLPAMALAQETRDATVQIAQADAAGADTGIEEIIVTARKTEERLTDAPVAVTAFTPEMLDNQNIRDLNDLSTFSPGLSFS